MTNTNPLLRRSAATLVTAGIAALVLSGCGAEPAASTPSGTAAPGDSSTHAIDESASELVPQEFSEDGKLLVAVDGTSAPDAMLAEDGTTLTGWQVDLGYALASTLGLDAEFVNTGIPTIIPGLENGKYEMGVATFGITPERMEVLDFVGNFVGGIGFVTTAGSDLDFGSIDDLCGLSVGVVQGTLQVDAAVEQDATCTDRGDEPVDIQQFPDKNAVALAITSDRVDLGFLDSTMTGYMVAQDPDVYEEIGEQIPLGAAGIQMAKGTGLAEAVQAAFQVLIDDGTYVEILEAYGVESGAVSTSTINDPDVR